MNTVPSTPRGPNRGFTLIELLAVIAIIGILAAITIPTVASVRNSAKKTKTKVQFSQWAAGIRLFKTDYGYYPRFNASTTASSMHRVNGALTATAITIADSDYLFREILSGQGAKPAGAGLGFTFGTAESTTATAQNKKHREFVHFDLGDITSLTGEDKAEAGTSILVDGAIKDSFGNVEIAVIVDRNGDGFINKNDLDPALALTFPSLTAKGPSGGVLLAETVKTRILASDPSGNGVRAEVIFYSPGKGGSGSVTETDAVWSW